MSHARLFHFVEKLETLSNVELAGDIDNAQDILRKIHNTVLALKDEISDNTTSQGSSSSQTSYTDTRMTMESIEATRSGVASTVGIDEIPYVPQRQGMGFIEAIRLAALNVENNHIPDSIEQASSCRPEEKAIESYTETVDTQASRDNFKFSSSSSTQSIQTASTTPLETETQASIDEQTSHNASFSNNTDNSRRVRRRKYFSKCFPTYRRLFRHETQPRSFLRLKHESNYFPALSPDTKHMALVDFSKFQIFSIPNEYNEKPILKFSNETELPRSNCYVAMNNNWLVIASWEGIIIVISIETGSVLFRKNLKLQITAIDISSDGAYIGIAVVKKVSSDRGVVQKQPLICLICPSTMISPDSAFEHPDIVSFSSPYKDFIRTISFNDGETALICSTEKENRIFIVSLADCREPRILLRSMRTNPDIDDNVLMEADGIESEGITGAKFLPNSRYVVLCSYAPNTPPIIMDTKLRVTKGKSSSGKHVQYLLPSGQRLNVVIRFDKMGSAIQSCVVSSRGDGAAFADYSGAVYAVNLPSVSTETRKISIVFDVAARSSLYNAPVLRFSPDGTALIAVDRKGDIHIADFGDGHPHQPGIMKSKVLS